MSESLVQIQNEKTRRDLFSLLSAVDAELARPVIDAPDEAIKQLLLEPAFLGSGGSSELSAPLVSIVLPTRDRAGSIADAILSVQAQSFSNWELIIVDDGSRDDTSNTVATFLADERLRLCPARTVGARGRAQCCPPHVARSANGLYRQRQRLVSAFSGCGGRRSCCVARSRLCLRRAGHEGTP